MTEVRTPVKGTKSPSKLSRVLSSIGKLFTSGKKELLDSPEFTGRLNRSPSKKSPVKLILERIESLSPKRLRSSLR